MRYYDMYISCTKTFMKLVVVAVEDEVKTMGREGLWRR